MKFLATYQQRPDAPPPSPERLAALAQLTQDSIKSGQVFLTGGIVRATKGTKVSMAGDKFTVTDGPFAETKELIDGFAILEADSKEHALELVRAFMAVAGDGEGEILQIFEGPADPH